MKIVIGQKKQGFSLVELMIVVTIIGVLATIGVPVFKRLRLKAYRTEGMTNLAHLNRLATTYVEEHPGYPLFEGYLVDDNDTNCVTDDPNGTVSSFNPMPGIGFEVDDCKNRRWAYYVKTRNPAGGGEWIVYAVSREKAIFGCPAWSEQITMSNCRRMCQKREILNSNCDSPPESFCGYTDAYACN